ncbi:MAG: M20/M25/M40 family metallo-hydrolase [Lactobacillus sp.]|nr:MAG: M20/M25/M40 family metallo-hydrolase [Lactobacillus sp.]
MTTIITEVQQAAVKALKRLINQPSVYDEPTITATTPFGKGIDAALTEVLTIASENGFKTYKDPNGNYGYAEIGTGEQIFGIIGHVDVVATGDPDDWDHDPFHAKVINDHIYGRGAQDDKGPTMAAMFAVKSLMDQGYQFNKTIRFIFGTDEESLWRDMKVYNANEKPIDLGIAPDAEFPLIYAEKGLEQAYLVGPGQADLSIDLQGAFNAVPAKASYNGPKTAEVKQALDQQGFDYQDLGTDGLTVIGKSVHAMNAPQGTNAVLRLAMALDQVFPSQPLDFLGKHFKEDATGTNILGNIEDQQSGHLTVNISSLKIDQNETRMQLDMRIPVTIDRDELVKKLANKIAPYDLHYEPYDYLAPLYVPTDSHLVKTLMTVYQDITGDQTPPQISGGATYARTMHHCVAYGAMLPGTPDFMHQVNENWALESMFKAMKIYAEAIKRLCVDDE